jgi:hypothetical protein
MRDYNARLADETSRVAGRSFARAGRDATVAALVQTEGKMAARLIATIVALAFAIGAFLGASPTTFTPNPFGLLFLGIAALIWFAWRPMSAGFDRPGIWDSITEGWLGRRDGDRSSASR